MIFISYRRNDEPGYVGRLADGLRKRFGTQHVFQDVDDIASGKDWQPQIESTLQQSRIVLAIIGKDWAYELQNRSQASTSELDVHKYELNLARKLGIPIIPVVLRNVALPDDDKLGELNWLLNGHAFKLHDGQNQWQQDLDKLATTIETSTGMQTTRTSILHRHWPPVLLSSVAILSIVFGVFFNRPDEQSGITADGGHASILPMPLGELAHNWEDTDGLSVILDAVPGSDAEHRLNNLKFPAGTGKQSQLFNQFCQDNAKCIACESSPKGEPLANATQIIVELINSSSLLEEEMKTADQQNVWPINKDPHLWENIDNSTGKRTIYSCTGE